MQVQVTTRQLRPTIKTHLLFLLDSSNRREAEKTLNAVFRDRKGIPEKWTEKDAKNYILDREKSIVFLGMGPAGNYSAEQVRRAIHFAVGKANELKKSELVISFPGNENAEFFTAMAETVTLSNYQYLHLKSEQNGNSLTSALITGDPKRFRDAVEKGNAMAEVTCIARDLVNEPVITLTAEELSRRTEKLGKQFGFRVEVLSKARIHTLKMGGLLAVNYGSQHPPTFNILEYKPRNAKNKAPIVLVGKGVVFDTGGLSLKETPGSMDSMKSDMAGAAAVIGALCGAARMNLPFHVVGLIPATDNRPGEVAVTPGDVIRISDGTTVEILNTDAEGRLILADALVYAKKYKPAVVIDLATLTGAAIIGVGHYATAMMASDADEYKEKLKQSGENVYERLVELPLWDEYKEQLRSDIADMKNIGGKPAGSITAGKFLEHFTDYPWIHLDIAGTAFLPFSDQYRGKNATGTGVRMLLDFIENF